MNSDSEPDKTITDEQLDALLREVPTPPELKQELLAIADDETSLQLKSNVAIHTPVWGRWLALAASLIGIALFIAWSMSPETTIPATATNDRQPQTTSDRLEAERLLAGIKQQQQELEYLMACSELNQLEGLLAEAQMTRQSRINNDEMISTVLAITDQTPILLGAPAETAIDDMQKIIDRWPGTKGATIAQQFIEQNQLKILKEKS